MPLTPGSFDNINDELEYYKNRTEELELDLAETKYGLEEFQLSSKELEEELEREIDSTEKRYNEIKIRNESMRQEVEEWKEKYNQSLRDSSANINQLTRQLEELRQQTEMFIKKERELEQNNDDLERTGRATEWSLQEMERKYNVALEKQAILENEINAKAALTEEVQRLKDELRDANVELAVMKSNQSVQRERAASVSSVSGSTSSVVDRKSPTYNSHEAMPSIRARLAKNNGLQRSESRTRPPTSVANGGGYIPPHQNPVQMVQEMVGRVKSLEARLVSCRSLVTPLLQPPPSYSYSVPAASRTSPQNSQAGSRSGSR
ncbi:Nuclear distribution protein nudE-like 1, partial [Entomortierella chlamydospora]